VQIFPKEIQMVKTVRVDPFHSHVVLGFTGARGVAVACMLICLVVVGGAFLIWLHGRQPRHGYHEDDAWHTYDEGEMRALPKKGRQLLWEM
jgi:hypothetical protein